MYLRIYAGLSLVLIAAAANAQDWLIAVDVPATVSGQLIRPGQIIGLDEADPTPSEIVSGLPQRVPVGALARRGDGSICWSPAVPAVLADSQIAIPANVYCHLEGTFTRIFAGSDFGLDRNVKISSISWNDEDVLHLSFSVPINASGSLAGPGTLVRVDEGTLTIAAGSSALPQGTSISAASFNADGHALLAPSTPMLVSGGLAHGLILLIDQSGMTSSNDVLAAMFDDPRRTGLSGLHRRVETLLEDLLFSDRFETP
jgi:hypothetical protein